MPLRDDIEKDFVAAMRARDAARLSALRLLRAAIQNREIELRPKPIEEPDVVRVIQGLVKQRREAAESFRTGGHEDRAQAEEAEAGVLSAYLPAALGDAELDALVADVVTEARASGQAAFGPVMKAAVARVAGRAEGQRVQAAVKRALGTS